MEKIETILEEETLEDEVEKVDFSVCQEIFEKVGERIPFPTDSTENEIKIDHWGKAYLIKKEEDKENNQENYDIRITKKGIAEILNIKINYDLATGSYQKITMAREHFNIRAKVEFTKETSSAKLQSMLSLDSDYDQNQELKVYGKRREIKEDYQNLAFYYSDYKIPSEQMDQRFFALMQDSKQAFYEENIRKIDDTYYHTNMISSIGQFPGKVKQLSETCDDQEANRAIVNLTINYQNIYDQAINYLGNDLITKFKIQKLLAMTECPTISYLDSFCCVPKEKKLK